MGDKHKTKRELLIELEDLRHRVSQLETANSEYKQAEESLRASEKRFRAMVEHSADGIVLLGADGSVVYEGPTVEQLTGFTAEERLGRDGFETIYPEDLSMLRGVFARILTSPGKSENAQFRSIKKDGNLQWLEGTATNLLQDENVQAIVINYRDITKRKEAEEALRNSEERFHLAMDATQDGLWDWNIHTDQVYYSPAYFLMLGYQPNQLPANASTWTDLIHPEDRERAIQVNADCIENRCERFEVEFRMQARDGTWKWVLRKGKAVSRDAEGRALRLIGTHTDITERKQTEEALQESASSFRAYFNMGTIGMCVASPEKAWVEVNDRLCVMLGYSSEELKGMTWAEMTHPDDLPGDVELFDQVLAGKRDSYQLEKRFIRKDGDVIHVLLYVTCQRNEDGSVRYFLASLVDITDLKSAVAALTHSHDLMSYIIEHNRSAVAVHDKDMKYVYVSQRYLDDYNVKEKDVIGKHHYEVFPDLPQKWRDVHQRVLKGEVLSAEDDPYVREDGSVDWTRWECRPWYETDGSIGGLIVYTEVITERKRAEEALRESETRFRAIFENSVDAIGVSNMGKHVFVNPAYLCLFKYECEDELIGRSILDLIAPECREQILENVRRRSNKETAPSTYETRGLRKDGVQFEMDVHTSTYEINGETFTVAHLRDVTERKQAEEALRVSEEKFRTITEQMTEVVFLTDLTGMITYCSPATRDIFGNNPEDMQGHHFIEFLLEDEIPKALAAFQKDVAESMPGERLELRMKHNDGTGFLGELNASLYRQNGTAAGTIGLIRDITERKNAEDALRASEERYRLLFETMAQGVVYQDTEGKIVSANPAAGQILGIFQDQMNAPQRVIREDGSPFPEEERPSSLALQSGQPVRNVVMGVFHPKNINCVWINVNAVPQFKPGESKPYQVYVTFEDISARKRNDDIMRARLRLLERASTHTVKELLQATLDEAGALVFSPIGFYHFVDPDQTALTLQAWSTRTRNEFCTASGEDSHYPIADAGVWADGARKRRPLIHNNYDSLENKRGLPEGHAKVVRELVVPVMRGDRMVAIMGVGNKAEDYTETDLEIVSALADFSWDIIQQRKMNEELRASEEQYRRLINVLPSGVVVHTQGRVELVNRAGTRFFGAESPDELIGTPLMERVHPDYRELVRERVRLSLEQGREAELIEEKLLRLDKGVFDAEVAAISVNYSGKPSTLAVFNEITERKKRERELHAIAALSAALRTAPTRAEMLPVIVEQIVSLLNSDAATVEIVEPHTGDVIIEAAQGVWANLSGARQKRGTGINAIISQTLKPYYSHDMENDPGPFFNSWAKIGIKGCVGVPLLAQGQLIGFIWIGRRTDIAENEVGLLAAVADIAANAIYRATLHEQTQKDAAELALAYDVTLEGWAHTLELRDQETEGHTRRVVGETLELARLMGVKEDEQENIRRGALLHDIGKLGIPDSVLLKPGVLNEREWEIMKRHPEYALNLLKRIDYLRPALDIPYCHHEKWDGTGYPRGLKGEEIPLPARIFAVVDVWDALTNDRPYRPAWTEENALKYVREQSGKHFDPEVAEAFLEIIKKKED